MKRGRVRRFETAQILYHWGQALPYLVLFLTGALILLQRLFLIELLKPESLALVHEIAGVTLAIVLGQICFVYLWTGSWRLLLRDLRECLSVKWTDVVWLALVPLQALFPGTVKLPPVGRYNLGQKLHLLFTVFAVPTFVATGLCMLLVRGALGPWILHLGMSFLAAGFLCLHIFLVFFNPSTRKSLGGMFFAHVTPAYVKEHHPLSLPGATRDDNGEASYSRLVSWRVLGLVVAAMTIGGLVAMIIYGPAQLGRRLATIVGDRGADAILPGELSASHRGALAGWRCFACHELFESSPSAPCLGCHERIAERMENRRGFHGQLEGECRSCHVEHRGRDADLRDLDYAAFNHEQALYHLNGRHRQLECVSCHVSEGAGPVPQRTRFVGLRFERCEDCHQDPHQGQMRRPCESCHSEAGWRGEALTFSHVKHSRFLLVGRHAALECDACHRAGGQEQSANRRTRYRGIEFSRCDSCHEDPHEGQMRSSCDTCHDEKGWKGEHLRFDHARQSIFPIDAAHEKVSCTGCHGEGERPRYRPLPTTCGGCHEDAERHMQGISRTIRVPPDPHAGRVDCEGCHPRNRQELSATEYAALCRDCHNRHYETVFHDWRRTFGIREARACLELESAGVGARELTGRVAEARAVGFHNLQLARRLWSEILDEFDLPRAR